ncbi:MAG: hypothetical protein RI947_428 [Candidatus Parcubacteria bacterium]|jgi:peptide-methionine (S)-S-oxide reductase
MSNNNEIAVFGGGCFWCTEAIYGRLKGVTSVVSGYAGGFLKNPSYHEVSDGNTGHAEVIQVTFDPSVITYEELLDVFWHTHDPTSLNKQGSDAGTQYRSIILYTTDEQRTKAEESKRNLTKSGEFSSKIVTEIKQLDVFYPAEDYHKDYFNTHEEQPYCQLVIAPKLQHFMKKYADKVTS